MNNKILVLVNQFPPQVDGVGDYTYFWSRAMADMGYELHILCRGNDKTSTPSSFGSVFAGIDNWNSPKSWKVILTYCTKTKPQYTVVQYVPYAFHLKGLPWGMVLILLLVRLLYSTQLLVFFHEVRIKINPKSIKSLVLGIPMWVLSGMIHYLSHQSVTSNPGFAKLLSNYGKSATIIPIGSNVLNSNSSELTQILTQEFKLNGFTLGVFGSGVRGWNVLIPVLKQVSQYMPEIRLFAIGKYTDIFKQKLEQLIEEYQVKENVILTGFLPAEQIGAYLNLIDLYLVLDPADSANTWTGTSTRSGSLAAALGSGCAVLGVRGELTGIALTKVIHTISSLDENTLKESIMSLAKAPHALENLKDSGLNYFQAYLAWNVIATKYDSILNGVSMPTMEG